MKRKHIVKIGALVLLISALFISCEGWSVADDIITQSASVTANYYTVTVYVDSVSAELKVATAPDPETITAVSDAINKITDKTLAGWYCEETGALYDSWGETLTGDLTVHAAWALTSDNMNTAFTSGGYYALTGDVTVSSYVSSNTKTVSSDLTVDLNGHTLDVTTGNTSGDDARFVDITSSAVVTFANGTLNINCGSDASITTRYETSLFKVSSATLNIDNLELTVNYASAIYPLAQSYVNITDSTIKVVGGYYALATNNAQSGTDTEIFTIKNSTIIAEGDAKAGYNSNPIMINRDAPADNSANTFLYIDNSYISGGRQAIVVRGGTAEITNSTLRTTGNYDPTYDGNSSYTTYSARDTIWRDNPRVIYATVALGCNTSGASPSSVEYTANTDVTFTNVTFENNARWTIGVGTAAGGSDTVPTVNITINSDQESLITTTCAVQNTVYVNGKAWTEKTNYYNNANKTDSSDDSVKTN